MTEIGFALLTLLIATVGTAVIGLLSRWIDRKVTARVQWRKGPPWYQPVADLLKLCGKETTVPSSARRTGFLLAPVFGFAATAAAAAILWQANWDPKNGFVGDLIVVLYLLTIPSFALVVGGSCSGNPHGAVGASREMKLILSYELPLVLAMIAMVLAKGTVAGGGYSFSIGHLITAPTPLPYGAIVAVLGFIVALFCIHAKLGAVPFDQSEAETEIMSGVLVEYSGPALAMVKLTKDMLLALLPIFIITVFWGGVSFGGLNALWSVLKYVLVLVLIVLIRNTNPRVRIDQAMKFFWYGLTPVSVAAVLISLIVLR